MNRKTLQRLILVLVAVLSLGTMAEAAGPKKVVHRIIDASPKRIVYVSCNPTTLAPNAAEMV